MFTYSQWLVDFLAKAAGHKYIKRIPYASGGKTRYRYIYHVGQLHQGKSVLDPEHMVAGASFQISPHAGQQIHAHILSVNDDEVTYTFDDGPRKGQKVTETKSALARRLDDTHGVTAKLNEARAARAKKIEDMRAAGASEKQIARQQARLAALGEAPAARVAKPSPAQRGRSSSPATEKVLALVKRYTLTAADVDYDALFPKDPPRKLADGSPNPDYALSKRLAAVSFRDPGDMAEAHNAALQRAAQELADMGLWDLVAPENADKYGAVKVDEMSPELEAAIRAMNVFEAPKTHPKYKLIVTGSDALTEEQQELVDAVTRTVGLTSHLYQHKFIGEMRINIMEGGRSSCSYPKEISGGLDRRFDIELRANAEPWTAIHEAVHIIETMSPNVQRATLFSTIPRISLGKHHVLDPGKEMAFEDAFMDPYAGKMSPAGASEYLTMALQMMMHDPDSALEFARTDPHSFITAYSILKGYHE